MAPSAVEVTTGETIHIPCSFEGIPTPSIRWSVNGRPLAVDDRLQVASTPRSATLTISLPTTFDTAVYTLTVENEAGSDRADIDVLVQCKMT